MAKNKPIGDNARVGAVKERTQVYNPKIERFVKKIQRLADLWM